jgi:hypothetical protein
MLQGQSAHAKVLAQVLFISRAFHFGLELFRKGHLMKTFKTALAAVAWAGISSVGAVAQTANHAWVQYDGLGVAQARVVVAKAANGTTICPSITHDNGMLPMTLRSDVAPNGFDAIRVCVGAVDPSMTNMTVVGLSLPTPVASPKRIAVIGDTGCRVKGSDVQDCDGLKPASTIKKSDDGTRIIPVERPPWDYVGLADATAAADPDLLIHVGDMHYREYGRCHAKCDQATVGYSWISWEADYFAPSKTLFAAAAMIPVRGNHEDCSRAWNGWFYLLDPHPIDLAGDWPAQCPGTVSQGGTVRTPLDAAGNDWNYTLPYPVVFDDFQVIVMDTSRIDRDTYFMPDPVMVKQYTAEFSGIELIAQGAGTVPSWLVTHRPFRAVASWGPAGSPSFGTTDKTLHLALAASVQKELPPQIKMTMAGHIHLAQQIELDGGRPPQLVFGNGGTSRDPNLKLADGSLHPQVANSIIDLGGNPKTFFTSFDFSFGLITPTTGAWNVDFHNKAGAVIHSSTIAN